MLLQTLGVDPIRVDIFDVNNCAVGHMWKLNSVGRVRWVRSTEELAALKGQVLRACQRCFRLGRLSDEWMQGDLPMV